MKIENWICPNKECNRIYHHSAFQKPLPFECPVCHTQLEKEKAKEELNGST